MRTYRCSWFITKWCENKITLTLSIHNLQLTHYDKNEFYIDATGQNGVLTEQVGLSAKSDLINDYAVIGNASVNILYKSSSSNGWLWSISLHPRLSYGYVVQVHLAIRN